MSTPHLKIDNLHTYFYSKQRQAFIHSVNGVSLNVMKGETLGIVGESGSGKSVTMLSLMGLINATPGVLKGSVKLYTENGELDLLPDLHNYVDLRKDGNKITAVKKDIRGWNKRHQKVMKNIWSKEISMIFQNPKAAFNPFETIGKQITESILLHTDIKNPKEAKEKALYWLEKVKIDSPTLRYENYPYGLSGGMSQRAMVAMALASEPSLLIADEPTTGLDATIQSKIVDLLEELKESLGVTLILISHDISVISRLSDKIAVMYAGNVLEHGPADSILDKTSTQRHPYTRALLNSIPSKENVQEGGYLMSIEGEVPDTIMVPAGCRFYERCQAKDESVRIKCAEENPPLTPITEDHFSRCWKNK
ncbi:MAG: ABC transporter ATP-binding protein [Gammaproteobacteria bacterium]|nr:ABC transporter ATP-binding protein [Gammaproteobacteria bacterium]